MRIPPRLDTLEGRDVPVTYPTPIPLIEVNKEPYAYIIKWVNQDLYVQESESTTVQPGNNFFSRHNVFVDDLGQLHIKYDFVNGQWRGAGVMLKESFGYGTYSFVIVGDVVLPSDLVFGAFTYDLSAPDPHREIDYEVGRFGNANDPFAAQFTTQPYYTAGNTTRFNPPMVGANGQLTVQLAWQPGQIDGYVATGDRNPLSMTTADRIYQVKDTPTQTVVPTHGNEFFRFNTWDTGGDAPADGRSREVVLSRFTYLPLAPTNVQATDGTHADKTVITWIAPPSAGAISQSVFRGTSSDPSQATLLAGNLSPTAMTYTDTTAVAGTNYTYFVRAYSADGGGPLSVGDSGFRQNQSTVVNDHFANRIALTGSSVSVTGTNVGATREAGEPNAVNANGGKSAWWTYTPNTTGKVTITTLGSNFDTTLAVFRGTALTSLTKVAENDDVSGGRTSSVTVDGVAGQPIQIMVDGFYGSSGTIMLNISTSAAPPAPTNVQASDGTYTDRVRVTFSSVSGATRYVIFRTSSNDSATAVQIGTTTSTAYDDLSAVAGTTYTYFVKAETSLGLSAFSAANTGYRQVPPPPPAPTNVQATDGTYTDRVRVSYGSVAGANSYAIFRATTNNSAAAVQIGTMSSTTFDDTTATPGTTYFYFVTVRTAAGTSAFSASNSGYRRATPPTAPTNVLASDGTSTDYVRVTFNAVANATRYLIYRAATNNSATAVLLGNATTTTFDDTTAMPRVTYFYFVKAESAGGVSSFSVGNSGFRQAFIGTVNFFVRENYASVFVADLTLTNTTNRAWSSWTLEFDLPTSITISEMWNAQFTRVGTRVTVRPLPWAAAIGPGQNVMIGFVGTPGNYRSGFANPLLIGEVV